MMNTVRTVRAGWRQLRASWRRALARWIATAPLWMLISCVPSLDAGLSTVTGPRVLAVRVEPAEVAPSEFVSLSILVATTGGPAPVPRVWRCDARRTLSESASVSQRCTGDRDASALEFVGEGQRVRAIVPADACARFGPNPPEPEPGEPAGRPVDPDPTGGYFVPFRIAIDGGGDAFAEVRVRCPLAGAPPSEVVAFNRADRGNENTTVTAIELRSGSEIRAIDSDGFRVRPGERLQISLRWPSCPDVDRCGDGVCGPEDDRSCLADCATVTRCEGAERYAFFDRASRLVTVRRESIRASFYQSAGTLRHERVGRADSDASAVVENEWTAPEQPGEQRLWFVLRDDRGGVSWRMLRALVQR